MAQELSVLEAPRSPQSATDQTVSTESRNEVENAENAQANPADYRMNKWAMLKSFFIRLLIMYFISSFFRQQRTPAPAMNSTAPLASGAGPATNLLSSGEVLDLYLYLTETKQNSINKSSVPLWRTTIRYGDWTSGPMRDGSYTFETEIPASDKLKNNGSLYVHAFFVKAGFLPYADAPDGRYSKKYTIYGSKKLTRQRRRQLKRTANLLTGESEGPDELKHNASVHGEHARFLPPTSHWHPNLTINLVEDYTPWTKGAIPAPLDEYIHFHEPTNQYYPILFFNDYWNLNDDYQPINETTNQLSLHVTFSPMSLFKWQLYAAQSLKKQWYSQFLVGASKSEENDNKEASFADNLLSTIKGGPEWLDEDGNPILTQDEEHEQDQLKKTMLETNPYLLALTVVVSLAHAVFEMLAFKNDIQFWNSRTSLAGLSVQSVLFNVFQSMVVVLYVLDNDTNFVIKMSVVVGACIEGWKVFKVLKFKVIWPAKRRQLAASGEEPASLFPMAVPRLEWAYEQSYVESDTKVYDQMAFKYLGWALFPLLGGYCIYSLVYLEHRGWYSWLLSMLYGFLLTFGFITMTPQLFINYKLKSVAHLPWRMLTYKALNTFIDDLFAFIIKAPTLYRIGCLRDDVIFFIYLYQRWIYPTDPTRINEFGVSQEMLDKRNKSVVVSPVPTAPVSVKNQNGQTTTCEEPIEGGDQAVRKRQKPKTPTEHE